MGTPVFGLPNGTLRQIAAQMFTQAYSDACGIDQRTSAINAGLRASTSPPKIAHAALIEMKYVKAGDPAPTPDQLAKIKAEAIDQLDQYSADPALIAEWHIGVAGVPPVAIHRLVLVFHGGECILNEEV